MADRLKRYAFINAKLKTRLGRLLPEEFFNRLIHAPTLNEAVQLLHDTPFRRVESVYAATGDLKMGELELFAYEIGLYRELKKFLAGELLLFLNALLLRFEIENLKQTLRLWLDRTVRKRDISFAAGYLFRGSIVHPIDWDALTNAQDSAALAALLGETPYAAAVASKGAAAENSGSLFDLENELDFLFFDGVHRAAQALDPEDTVVVERIIGVEIDMENLSRVFRFKHFYNLPADRIMAAVIPGGYRIDRGPIRNSLAAPTQEHLLPGLIGGAYPEFSRLAAGGGGDPASRLTLIEELLTEIQRAEIRKLLFGNPFTIGIMLAYFFMKHREILRVSTILNSKLYGLDEDALRRQF